MSDTPSSAPSSGASASSVDPSKPATKLKTNRLFLAFALLSFAVAAINIQFHHRFHDEHVHELAHRQFKGRFRTSRHETDDYVPRRGAIVAGEPQLQTNASSNGHKLAGLRCGKYGGPDDEYAEREMAFWSDIPSDASYKSPFMDGTERFLAFEPDHGGWNNIRMAMESALVMSHAMGRTLVLPPQQRFYLLGKADSQQTCAHTGRGKRSSRIVARKLRAFGKPTELSACLAHRNTTINRKRRLNNRCRG